MGYLIDFLHPEVIILPEIFIPVNLTDFNLLINKSLHAKSTVKQEIQKYIRIPAFKGMLTLAEGRQTST